jgi:glycosyltransferase involved in cell wall biosynthesis
MTRLASVFLVWGFFFIFPLTAVLVPNIEIGGLTLNAELLWMLTGSVVAATFLATKSSRLRFSPMIKAYALFVLYFIVRTWIASREIMPTHLAYFGSGLLFLSLMENLPVIPLHRRTLFRLLFFLAVVICVVSILQFFVSPTIYYQSDEIKRNLLLGEERFRSLSIFTNMEMNQGPIGMLALFAVFLFSPRTPGFPKRLPVCLMLFISLFLTLFRYAIVGALLLLLAFLYYRFKRKILPYLIGVGLFAVAAYLFFLPMIFNTEILFKRATSGIQGRFDAPIAFLTNHLRDHPLLFGIGFSSYSEPYYYPDFRRLHSGNWDLLFHVGLVGLVLYAWWLWRFYKFGRRRQFETGSPLLAIFVLLFIFINFTSRLYLFYYWGYLLIYFVGWQDESRKNRLARTKPAEISGSPPRPRPDELTENPGDGGRPHITTVAYVILGHFPYISRAKKQIEALVRRGFRVDVYNGVTSDENPYPSLSFSVHKIFLPRSGSRTMNFVRVIRFNFAVSRRLRKRPYDFVICRELSTLLAGVLCKRKNPGIRLVFDNNELSVERYGGLKKMTWGMIQKRCLPLCDTILHAERNRLEYFVRKHHLTHKHNVLLENFPLRGRASLPKDAGMIRAVYFGGIGKGRDIEAMIRSFASVSGAELDLVGYGKPDYLESLRRLIAETVGGSQIRILPPVSDRELNEFFAPYNVGLAFYPNININNFYCAPNKIYQYIQSGLAVIANDYPGLRSLIEGRRIGSCVASINREELTRAIRTIAEEKRHLNITESLKDELSWERVEPDFLSVFESRRGEIHAR